jgi:hypothetical protein
MEKGVLNKNLIGDNENGTKKFTLSKDQPSLELYISTSSPGVTIYFYYRMF